MPRAIPCAGEPFAGVEKSPCLGGKNAYLLQQANVEPPARRIQESIRMRKRLFLILVLPAILCAMPAESFAVSGGGFPTPQSLLGLPYRPDGVIDENGRNTLFATPTKSFETPGLNCSGFVVSASRGLLHKNITLDQAKTDRLGDSGPSSPLGQDWDYGLDLILNISEGIPRRIIGPEGRTPLPERPDGLTQRGFPLDDDKAWKSVLPLMRPGHIYLATISKPAKRKGYVLMHYHVALIVPDREGRIFWYHSTPKTGVHRLDLRSPEGMRAFQREFRGKVPGQKKVFLLEADAPAG